METIAHPAHYQGPKGIEVVSIWEALDIGFEAYLSNVIKYLFRYGKKNGLEDLKKAQWYLNKLVENHHYPKGEYDNPVLQYSLGQNEVDLIRSFNIPDKEIEVVLLLVLLGAQVRQAVMFELAKKLLTEAIDSYLPGNFRI